MVQYIAGDCVSVQFLKRSGEKTFSIRDGDFDDCLCCHIKAVIKEGQFTMNTCGQYLIEERYLPRNLSMQLFYLLLLYVVSYILFKNCFPSKHVL